MIGGGAAGARAALKSREAGHSTTMVVKGLLGKSGCSIFAGNLNYLGPPQEFPQTEEGAADQASYEEKRLKGSVEFMGRYTHWLGDQEYMKHAARFTQEEFFPWMVRTAVTE